MARTVQADLFERDGRYHPDTNRTEPVVWLKEMRVLRILSDSPEAIVRKVKLQRGLNIVWSEPQKQTVEKKRRNRVSGHAAGKTTFCRFVRHLLGEATFANDDVRPRIRQALPKGWITGEVMLSGNPWLVCRPIEIGPHPFVIRGGSFGHLSDKTAEREPLEKYLTELTHAAIQPLSVPEFFSSPRRIEWGHLIQWLARDQEARFAGLVDFRHSSSDSQSPELSAEDGYFLIRSVQGLLEKEERAALMALAKDKADVDKAGAALPLLRHDLARQKESLGSAFPEIQQGSEERIFLEAVKLRADERLSALKPLSRDEVERARKAQEEITLTVGAATSRVTEISETFQEAEDRMRALAGDPSAPKTDEWLRKKAQKNKWCMETLAAAIEFECPLAAGRELSTGPRKPLNLEDQKRIAAETRDALKRDLEEAQRNLSAEKFRLQKAKSRSETLQRAYDAQLLHQAEEGRRLKDLQRQALASLQIVDRIESATESLQGWEKKRKEHQEAYASLRDQNARHFGILSSSIDRVFAKLLGEDYTAQLQYHGRTLRLNLRDRGEISSTALQTFKVVGFDFASLVMSVEGEGDHPRFLLHDSPREADLEPEVYEALFEEAAELQRSFPPGAGLSFQYIVTTTASPPEGMRTDDWVVMRLNSVEKENRFLCEDL